MSYVYGMLAKAHDNCVYIKFGHTKDIDRRVKGVQTGCPLEIVKVFHVEAGNSAELIERYLHSFFGHRLAFGEWFSFDLSDQKQKDEFGRGCFQAFTIHLGSDWEWIETAVNPALRKWRDGRRKRLMAEAKALVPKHAKEARNPYRNFWMNGVI